MLTTKQSVFRRYRYATHQIESLRTGPRPFTLMGENIVLFLDEHGVPAALEDRCCHRTAKLSKGRVEDGLITCGYHGWTHDRQGTLIRIPQFAPDQIVPRLGVKPFHCQSRYGHAWVCLGEPLADIPSFPEEEDPGFRRIMQFHTTWKTAPLRMMENSFDNAHFSFVQKSTFGQIKAPKPSKYEITETDYGFEAETIIDVNNPPAAHRVTGKRDPTTQRHMRNKWYMPFARRLDMAYPSGFRHIIMNCATPIDVGTISVAQVLFRNDKEECSTEEPRAWDAVILEEDRDILESTDPDTTVDMGRKVETHMPSDKPGMVMRKRLTELLAIHGEGEVFRR